MVLPIYNDRNWVELDMHCSQLIFSSQDKSQLNFVWFVTALSASFCWSAGGCMTSPE